jgi:hypothetical protein
LVCPPLSYADYYAIKPFDKKDNYVIYIGEMGASDGGKGVYKYMHDEWELVYKNPVFYMMCGTQQWLFIKELFLFKSKK